MRFFLMIIFFGSFLTAHAQTDTLTVAADSIQKSVIATYYHKKFEGRKTSSGARYSGKKLTAAHRTLPFGTLVKVTNPDNGKSVVVKVNDRGPFSKKLAIDLSESAAKQIGIFRKGIAKVDLKYVLE